jgi:hypothetical protein
MCGLRQYLMPAMLGMVLGAIEEREELQVLSCRKLSLWLAAVTVMVVLTASPALAQASGGDASASASGSVAVTATAGSTAATVSAASSVPPSASASALAGTGGPPWISTLASAAALALVVTGVAALAFTLRRGAS